MAFQVAQGPFEQNTGYINLRDVDYPTFSLWFDYVKLRFNNAQNASELKSDRMEAIHNIGKEVFTVGLCERGYGMSTAICVLVKGSSVNDNEPNIAETVPLPTRLSGESKVDLTKRWVGLIQDKIVDVLSRITLRVVWENYTYEGDEPEPASPPDLMPPD